jgi:hypothetical protein
MRNAHLVVVVLCSLSVSGGAAAETFGSIEPIGSTTVFEIGPLLAQDLEVRTVFAERLQHCGIVDDVERVLAKAHLASSLNERNTRFQVAGGGFAGNTNPTYAFSVIDSGANAAAQADFQLLADSLGYVMSQDSVFLLDSDDPTALDFPTNYVVLEFRHSPRIERSAALFETVGRIDPELFETDTSGYTQFGRSYVSTQSDVPDDEFIAGYVQAAADFGVEYTPIIDGVPSLFHGSAAFPGNDWAAHPHGEDYLSRIPRPVHDELARLRQVHTSFTRKVLRKLARHDADRRELLQFVQHLDCR